MTKLLNWTSLTFFVTVVGLAIPIWLWRADLDAKSLSLQLTSQTPLTSDSANSIKGLEVLMDGVKVASPTVSVVTLTNNGKKPLPASEFESPVEVRVAHGSQIFRAEVTSSHPKDIEARIEWNKTSVRFVPVLLNPDESITISLLTEGERPTFTSRARVVGVTTVDFVDNTKKPPAWRLTAILLIASLLLFVASDIVDPDLRGGPPVLFVRKRAAFFIKIVCSGGGVVAYTGFALSAEIDGIWAMVLGLLPTMLFTALIGAALNNGAKARAKVAESPPKPLN
ncbi:hypothetical protein [uncultured Rhodoferax sp.]|uniref:hypothetical protein n=1 Tax=uncultured Rhodoferax sp. TaxID=223188 RepID=UPI0025FD0A18|nr:hypothetical protein [uncultured Rhodoferax sp.]